MILSSSQTRVTAESLGPETETYLRNSGELICEVRCVLLKARARSHSAKCHLPDVATL